MSEANNHQVNLDGPKCSHGRLFALACWACNRIPPGSSGRRHGDLMPEPIRVHR